MSSIEQRLANLAISANSPESILNVARIVATTGSRFVFQFPDSVMMFLGTAKKLNATEDMVELLVMSACGGGRGYINNQLDKEFRYIREEAEKLIERFAQIPILKDFYDRIVQYEDQHEAANARMFPTNEDFDE